MSGKFFLLFPSICTLIFLLLLLLPCVLCVARSSESIFHLSDCPAAATLGLFFLFFPPFVRSFVRERNSLFGTVSKSFKHVTACVSVFLYFCHLFHFFFFFFFLIYFFLNFLMDRSVIGQWREIQNFFWFFFLGFFIFFFYLFSWITAVYRWKATNIIDGVIAAVFHIWRHIIWRWLPLDSLTLWRQQLQQQQQQQQQQ